MPAALVTGSAKGIGKAILLELARTGFDVMVHYRTSEAEAQAVLVEAESFGVSARVCQADVTNPEEAKKLVDNTYQAFRRLDVLVNNVGDYHRAGLAEVSNDDWHRMFDSNLHATFYTCQSAIGYMRQGKFGRIINLGFAGAEQFVARPEVTAYSIAKTGIILYSKALAKSEAKNSITVNVISPGVMENSETKPIEQIPLARTGKMHELTSAVSYLVSEEAAYITGVTMEIAGGWHL